MKVHTADCTLEGKGFCDCPLTPSPTNKVVNTPAELAAKNRAKQIHRSRRRAEQAAERKARLAKGPAFKWKDKWVPPDKSMWSRRPTGAYLECVVCGAYMIGGRKGQLKAIGHSHQDGSAVLEVEIPAR